MGSGKGSPEYWVAVVKPGRVMFEMDGVSEADAKEAMRLAANKLPIKCKFVKKEGYNHKVSGALCPCCVGCCALFHLHG